VVEQVVLEEGLQEGCLVLEPVELGIPPVLLPRKETMGLTELQRIPTNQEGVAAQAVLGQQDQIVGLAQVVQVLPPVFRELLLLMRLVAQAL
jgi:hypothetical protein